MAISLSAREQTRSYRRWAAIFGSSPRLPLSVKLSCAAVLRRVVDVRVSSRKLTKKERQKLTIYLEKAKGDWDYDALGNYFEQDDLIEWGFEEYELGIEEVPEFPEEVADNAEYLECPKCGHSFPK